MSDRDGTEPVQGLPKSLDHPQIVGIGGVALGVIGVVLLVAGTSPVEVLLAGYNFGAGTILILLEVFSDVE